MPYHEAELTKQFTQWFVKEYGYEELLEDRNTDKGSRMDSVGRVGDVFTLIEFKHTVYANSVLYKDNSAGALEQKIGTTLRYLYEGGGDQMVDMMLRGWDKLSIPWIIVVANKISTKGFNDLDAMFKQRTTEWLFEGSIICWGATRPKQVFRYMPRLTMSWQPTGNFPDMAYIYPDRSKKEWDHFVETAEDRGIGELFNALVDRLEERGCRRTCNVQNVNFRLRNKSGQWSDAVLAIWPQRSSRDEGMLVCYNPKWFRDEFGSAIEDRSVLPGVSTARVGHIGPSRYLRTVAEVDAFWAMLTSGS